jgi:bacteriocin biosynthesis cyclodehydratase domain-containing protein
LKRPLLPDSYAVWFEPPDENGDEVLHVVSDHRAFRLKGHSYREFCERVVPLLDGSRTLEEIQELTSDVFRPNDLEESLRLLESQGIVVEPVEGALPAEAAERMAPQLNLLRDLAPDGDAQGRLAAASVAVIGLGGAGPTLALGLAAAGVGTLRFHDPLPVLPTDVYYAPFLGVHATGDARSTRIEALVHEAAPQVDVRTSSEVLESEDDLRAAVRDVDFVVSCLDAGQSNLTFKLNRVCLETGQPWGVCALGGAEVVVGPVIHPNRSACYLCYRMRAVACAGNPEDAFAYERYLDRRRTDDSGRRQNLVFGAGIAGNVLASEIVKALTGLAEPSLVGRILTLQLTDLRVEHHTVLRKPWCPACSPSPEGDVGG